MQRHTHTNIQRHKILIISDQIWVCVFNNNRHPRISLSSFITSKNVSTKAIEVTTISIQCLCGTTLLLHIETTWIPQFFSALSTHLANHLFLIRDSNRVCLPRVSMTITVHCVCVCMFIMMLKHECFEQYPFWSKLVPNNTMSDIFEIRR